MILKINNWFGRLGNNLIQLRNIILIALYYNYNIKIPSHPFFIKQDIILNQNTDKNIYIDNEGNNFFYSTKINKFNKECFLQNINKMKQILKDIFIIKYDKLTPLDDNDLVIHIRGGDIFSHSPHPGYIPPPLSYYVNIIENNNYDKIYLINDIDNNPCISLLKQKYPNIVHEKKDLTNDIIKIISAKNIVYTVGTFPCSLLFLTKYTKNIYYPSYSIQVNEILDYFNDINFNKIDYNNYKNKIDKWKNTHDQINLMVTN